jgi:hypothetical protein
MTKQRWEELKEILGESLELEASARTRFVHSAAAHDPELLAELLRVLDERSGNSGFLSRPPYVGARPLWPSDTPEFAPDSIVARRFRILRFIARGGMGDVYEAEDLDIGGRIALKAFHRHLTVGDDFVPLGKGEVQLARRVCSKCDAEANQQMREREQNHGSRTPERSSGSGSR